MSNRGCRLHPSTLSDSVTSLRFPCAIPGVQAHHWTAGIAPTTSIARKGAEVATKVIAASILDLLTSTELRAAAKKAIRRGYQKDQIFFPIASGRQAAG